MGEGHPGLLWDWRRFGRLMRVALALTLAALAAMVLPPWLRAILPAISPQKAAIGFLIGLEVAYGVVLLAALIGTAVLGGILYRTRRGGLSRPMAAAGC